MSPLMGKPCFTGKAGVRTKNYWVILEFIRQRPRIHEYLHVELNRLLLRAKEETPGGTAHIERAGGPYWLNAGMSP
jgi:hypothetical protein